MSNYSSSVSTIINKAIYRVYGWMGLGLGLTGFISYSILSSESLFKTFSGSMGLALILFIAQIGIIMFMAGKINTLKFSEMVALFMSYSAINGITLSWILVNYTVQSIFGVLFLTAGIFSLMAIYGIVTKHDLSAMGSFFMNIFFGMVVLSVLNIFFRSASLEKGISFIIVIVISGLISYETQNLKNLFSKIYNNEEMRDKLTIFGALSMYQNFIVLFIRLLHLLGERKRRD